MEDSVARRPSTPRVQGATNEACQINVTPPAARSPTQLSPSSTPRPQGSKNEAGQVHVTPPGVNKPLSPTHKPRAASHVYKPRVTYKPWVVNKETQKQKWTLPKMTAPILIIGDSSVSKINKSRSSENKVQVCSFPGLNLYNMAGLLKRTPENLKVTNLVLNISLNVRTNNVKTTSLPLIRQMISHAKTAFPNATVSLAALQWDPRILSTAEIQRLEELQQGIASLKGIEVIPAVKTSSFEAFHTNNSAHCWTTDTANNMMDHWLNHLN